MPSISITEAICTLVCPSPLDDLDCGVRAMSIPSITCLLAECSRTYSCPVLCTPGNETLKWKGGSTHRGGGLPADERT